jgi:hypothetical protein
MARTIAAQNGPFRRQAMQRTQNSYKSCDLSPFAHLHPKPSALICTSEFHQKTCVESLLRQAFIARPLRPRSDRSTLTRSASEGIDAFSNAPSLALRVSIRKRTANGQHSTRSFGTRRVTIALPHGRISILGILRCCNLPTEGSLWRWRQFQNSSGRGGQSHFPPKAPENRDSPQRF